MNNIKEIAEKILNCKTYDIPDIQELASAYLELEKELTFRKDAEIPVYKEEITKLEEENEQLRGLADFDAFSRENFNNINAKQSSEIVKLKAEIEKLKEEKESIRTQLLAQCIMSHELADEKEGRIMSLIDTCEKCGEDYYIKTVHKCSGKMGKPEITKLKEANRALEYENYQYEIDIKELRAENENLKKCIDMLSPKVESNYLNNLSTSIHEDNVKAGWWTDLATGLKKERNVGELLCLVHSEVSEALEGYRKDLMDDKLPHRKAFEVELADALIRIFDIAGAFNLDLDGSIAEKRAYNAKRDDHKLENRMSANGKRF